MEEVKVEVPAKFKDVVAGVEKLTLIELHELVKLLEAKWGVSAAAAVVAGPAAGPAGRGLLCRSPPGHGCVPGAQAAAALASGRRARRGQDGHCRRAGTADYPR